MPNWCNNNATISHTDPAKMQALAEAINKGEFCRYVIPVPESLNITAGREGDDDDPKQIALVAAEKANIEKYGVANWYDFCVNNWGTKWDVDPYEKVAVDEHNTIEFGFDSAWAPPVGIYEELTNQGFYVTAWYYEPGMAYVGKYEDGYDECLDFGGETSATVRDVIGEELDDMYGISEAMAEYEEEEKDDVQVWYEDGVESKGLEPHENKS